VDTKHIPEGFDDPDLDDQTKKKMIQVMRNRVSAQTSRDKKKVYVNQLEDMKNALADENSKLSKEKADLAEKLKKIEREREALRQEVEMLKNRGCSKCGSTMEYQSPASTMNQETTEESASNSSSPLLYRDTSRRGGFFGFGVAFAAFLCFLFCIGQDVFSPKTLINVWARMPSIASSQSYQELENAATKLRNEMMAQKYNKGGVGSSMEANVESENSTTPADQFEFGPYMQEFGNFHKDLHMCSEKEKAVIDISQNYFKENATKFKKNSKKPFLSKNSSITSEPNKTSTIFCPNSFEFINDHFQVDMGKTRDNSQTTNQNLATADEGSVGLDKADYVQLFIPRRSLNQISLTQNSSDLSFRPPSIYEPEQENALLEVWCKVFAVREITASF
jgi:hypothetical protein